MSLSQPLSKTGRYLLDALGITKSTDAFLLGLNREVSPVINISPFIAVEGLIEFSDNGWAAIVGLEVNQGFVNNTGKAVAVYGATIFSAALAAGESCEVRPVMMGVDATNPFHAEIGRPDFASGVLESLYSGGLFFDSPLILLPGWRITSYVSTLSAGAAITLRPRVLYSVLG